jgi:hypothetical protein
MVLIRIHTAISSVGFWLEMRRKKLGENINGGKSSKEEQ